LYAARRSSGHLPIVARAPDLEKLLSGFAVVRPRRPPQRRSTHASCQECGRNRDKTRRDGGIPDKNTKGTEGNKGH
jgi:hypothetical protein